MTYSAPQHGIHPKAARERLGHTNIAIARWTCTRVAWICALAMTAPIAYGFARRART